MRPNSIHRQHSQGKKNPTTQLWDFENILKARNKPFKHGQSPSLVHRPAQFSSWPIR